jgi:hypothetical protein
VQSILFTVLFCIVIAIRALGRRVDLPLVAIVSFVGFFIWMFAYNIYARRRELRNGGRTTRDGKKPSSR